MARFDGITTTIYADALDTRDLKNIKATEVEYVYDGYTRSDKMAEEILRSNLGLESFLVLINFKYEYDNVKKEYDIDKLWSAGYTPVLIDEIPEEPESTTERIPVTMYRYTGNVYAEYREDFSPYGEHFRTNWAPQKLTKSYQREVLKEIFEASHDDMRVVYINRIGRETDSESFVIEFPKDKADLFVVDK